MTHELDTGLPADAVEFCPDERFESLAICGTYSLTENKDGKGSAGDQTRTGQLHIVRTISDRTSTSASPCNESGAPFHINEAVAEISLLSTASAPGIFDIKWCGVNASGGMPVLGQAAANGKLLLHQLPQAFESDPIADAPMELVSAADCRRDHTCSSNLALSLDWNNRKHKCGLPGAAVSMSDGSIALAEISPTGLVINRQWQAHDMEAWIVAYDCHEPTTLFTGADDGKLKMWDIRTNETANMVKTNSKSHQAGVCSIQANIHNPWCVATGSYDEVVRIWDPRKFQRPLAEEGIGGGVWRLKWHPNINHSGVLLCAAMHNGFSVLNYDHSQAAFPDSSSVRFVGGHKSLGYGVDWQCTKNRSTNDSSEWIVASASFYDHRMEVWGLMIKDNFEHDSQDSNDKQKLNNVNVVASDRNCYIPGGWNFVRQ